MSNWIDVADEGDLFEGAGIGVAAQGHDVAIYKTEAGEVYATDNICSHVGHGRLCDGFLEGHEIECPLHQGRFDIRSGAATLEPCEEAIRSYPVKIEGGRVWLDLA
ncbi:non-heme iron oxygenase ferredoxin subunit [Ottowia sp.]|uniref:non-heme iron oxygenase ferredoxin subunit n=1 Tax=Ottowia sp. TaxID=1898956 RepID=UPI002C02AA05|nr:non-heme iron oxygenase ferredoxin subunit [Ottowia sp.]HRN76507.1 non-heme iron oxygenase ferredoxin subunit [Ottowia sp.]HRQ03474.1 non-heme iron oxygenase ferredoxin subunit [Ottowia sp.]